MAKQRKFRFNSRQEAEQAYEQANRENTIYHCVLNLLLRNQIEKTFKSGLWTIHVLAPHRADGGFVVVMQKVEGGTSPNTYSHAYYLEDWIRDTKATMPAPSNREGFQLRQLAYDVEAYVRRKMTA